MTAAELRAAALHLRDSHPATPLDIYRTIARMHHHQRRNGCYRSFRINAFGALLGLADDVVVHEYTTQQASVERAYRANVGVSNTAQRAQARGLKTRYVIEDPDGHSRIVTY